MPKIPRHKEQSRKKKKKKNIKKKEKDSSSLSSSSSSASSSTAESVELFQDACRGDNGLASKIQKVARKHPGRLLRSTLHQMHEHLHPGKAVSGVPPILHQFLQSAMIAQNQVQGAISASSKPLP